MYRARGAAAAASSAYAALAALVAAGELCGIDRWAVDHAMPGARFTGRKPSLLDALIPLRHVQWHGVTHVAAELVTLPASVVPATILVASCCLRIGGRRAVGLGAAYVLANGIEELTKSALTRPALRQGSLHLASFDSSYPSGHAVRAVLIAVGVALAWPVLGVAGAVWAACAVVMLEVGGFHVPSDIAGGLLLATALVTAATAAEAEAPEAESSAPLSGPSRACRPSSRAR